MTPPTAPALSKLFSQLTGRSVRFSLVSGSPSPKAKTVYGVYHLPPSNDLLIVSADRLVIGQFGGALLGLPPSTISGRIDEYQTDESLRDAMHEIMNVAATPISPERRAVLCGVFADKGQLEFGAKELLGTSKYPVTFQVSIDDVTTGHFAVLA